MNRPTITAALVSQAEQMLDAGAEHEAIASRLGVTHYVVGVLARTGHIPPCKISHHTAARNIPNTQRGVDATTIRRIRRMLDVGMLNHKEIARFAGVAPNTVTRIAQGKCLPVPRSAPYLQPDERRLLEPVRCSVCHGLLLVAPCRACRTRRAVAAKKSV